MEEGKETKGKLTTEPKIQRTSEEERDRLSELPDFVLLHIMNFIYTKDALRTCILSKHIYYGVRLFLWGQKEIIKCV